jgi:putative hydroxymethylpyrimidine transport system ATP-binding protein
VPPGLRFEGLVSHYGGHQVFSKLNWHVSAGELTALLGPSGVGKTTLLKIAAGLATPSAGRVTATDGRPLQHRIAYMGQQDLLYPWLNVTQNVMLGARLRGEKSDPTRATALLASVGLADRPRALPATLSGGMRQRVAIARTLYENRPIVLMDEPFSALDSITRARIQDLAAELLTGRTVLLITHDPFEACRLAQDIVILSGHPATLSPPIRLEGPSPRPADDNSLLHTQARLLRDLRAQASE